MSNGEDNETTADSLIERLDAAAEALSAAETEADLDEVEADLDAIETDLEATELPVADDEDEESPADDIDSQLADLRDQLADKRGPYAEDVTEAVEAAKSTIEDGEWTEQGETEVRHAVEGFAETVGEILDQPVDDEIQGLDSALDALSDSAALVSKADLDPDRPSMETLF